MSETFGIIGLGLVGGSLARAIRASDPSTHIVAVEPNPNTRAQALAEHVVDTAIAAPGDALRACTLIVVCVPLPEVESALRGLSPHLSPDVLITDVVAVKAPVLALAARLLPDHRFVGAHPMAGGARGGFERSDAEVFAGCSVAICAPANAEAHATRVGGLWQRVGAHPIFLSAERHDQIVAATSHLPYIAALALIRSLADAGALEGLFGRGLIDATRHAEFLPQIMAAAAAANPALPAACRQMAQQLAELADLAEHDGHGLSVAAEQARALRDELLGR